MGRCKEVCWDMLYWCARYRVQLIVVLTPFLLLPLPLVIGDDASVAGFLLLWMAVYWCTDIIPLAVTGLIPVFFLPMAELLPLKEVCHSYLDSSMMMVVGSMIVALSIEQSNLHRRIALSILRLVGAKPQWLMFGFMLPTFILSMFINNTSTTAMMMPIAEAVLDQLDPKKNPPLTDGGDTDVKSEDAVLSPMPDSEHTYEQPIDISDENSVPLRVISVVDKKDDPDNALCVDFKPKLEDREVKLESGIHCEMAATTKSQGVAKYTSTTSTTAELIEHAGSSFSLAKAEEEVNSGTCAFDENRLKFNDFAKSMTLCVCYSANVGGVATLTGTTPNVIMSEFVEEIWASHGLESPVNYATWMVYGMPIACICFFVVWGWLLLFYMGYRGFMCCCCAQEGNEKQEEAVRKTIRDEYDRLGSLRYEELASGFMFVALILLWFFRSPGFMPGWADGFEDGFIGDAVPAILIAFCLFVIPADFPKSYRCGYNVEETEKTKKVRVLLDWQTVHSHFPWSIIFLVGGGYALADACDVSGLSEWIGEQLTVLGVLPSFWMIFFLCILVGLLTTVMTNSAACTILMPIMAAMAESLGLNPLYLMFPVSVSCSMAFMLPVATPPNAIAYSFGRVSVLDMLKAGSMLNVLCAFVITIGTETWGKAFFDFETIPWDTSPDNVTTTVVYH